MKTENAWHGLTMPALNALSAKRADPSHPFDFFYALNAENHCVLLLQLKAPVTLSSSLPRLKGVQAIWIKETCSLQLVLAKQQDAELFELLCKDLMACTRVALDHSECLHLLRVRLGKWQRLFSKGGPRLLDPQEIRGLFAELTFLLKELLPVHGPEAMNAWKGPSGFPQDFAADNEVFEIKSHLVGSPQSVRISSPSQLWVEGSDLRLCVYHLAEVSAGGMDLGRLVDAVSQAISHSPKATEQFEEKLATLRYIDSPEYRLQQYSAVKLDVFMVTDGFPRLIPSALPAGIHEVTYSIQMAALAPYQTSLPWHEV